MKAYRGTRGVDGLKVSVDDRPLDPRYDIKRIASGGFEWTYEGDGPAQLALAILADHLEDERMALDLHQDYMRRVISNLDNDWEITSDEVAAVVAALMPRKC